MADHYELLGVSRDATKDQIRDAYRTKKDALAGTESESARRETGRLNEAWQTLADPTQRGRYDDALDSGRTNDDLEVVDDESDVEEPAPRPRGLFSPREGAQKREMAPPAIDLPSGTRFPETRPRVNAMLFDIAIVVLIFFVLFQFTRPPILDAMHADEVDALSALEDKLDANNEALDDANNDLSDAEDALADAEQRNVGVDDAKKKVVVAQDEVDSLEKEQTEIEDDADKVLDKLVPGDAVVLTILLVFGLGYLVVPSMRNGQTVGKRLRHVRVVRVDDGAKPTVVDLLRRYGPLVVIMCAVQLRPLAPFALPALVAVLISILVWIRSPDRQGIHDRFAHTTVVEDIPSKSAAETPRGGTR